MSELLVSKVQGKNGPGFNSEGRCLEGEIKGE